jgi:cell division transport system permease protein
LAENIKVVLYLKEHITQGQISSLRQKLEGCQEISGVRFISKSEALNEFRKSLGDDAILLDGLKTNPLPASFELSMSLSLKDSHQLKPFLHKLSTLEGVEDIQGGIEWIQRMSGLLVAIRLILFSLGAILTVISLLIIASTIHFTIDSRREEIAIMRLVGATEWYIRFPFLFEGVMKGLLGGCLALAASGGIYYAFCWKVSPFLKSILGISTIGFWEVRKVVLILATGSLLGGCGALLPFFLHSRSSNHIRK